jgi:hypothetical protein
VQWGVPPGQGGGDHQDSIPGEGNQEMKLSSHVCK